MLFSSLSLSLSKVERKGNEYKERVNKEKVLSGHQCICFVLREKLKKTASFETSRHLTDTNVILFFSLSHYSFSIPKDAMRCRFAYFLMLLNYSVSHFHGDRNPGAAPRSSFCSVGLTLQPCGGDW
ncbi:hypothetical protein ACOSP7_029763 [Xanthoceras sorbifolium]